MCQKLYIFYQTKIISYCFSSPNPMKNGCSPMKPVSLKFPIEPQSFQNLEIYTRNTIVSMKLLKIVETIRASINFRRNVTVRNVLEIGIKRHFLSIHKLQGPMSLQIFETFENRNTISSFRLLNPDTRITASEGILDFRNSILFIGVRKCNPFHARRNNFLCIAIITTTTFLNRKGTISNGHRDHTKHTLGIGVLLETFHKCHFQ